MPPGADPFWRPFWWRYLLGWWIAIALIVVLLLLPVAGWAMSIGIDAAGENAQRIAAGLLVAAVAITIGAYVHRRRGKSG